MLFRLQFVTGSQPLHTCSTVIHRTTNMVNITCTCHSIIRQLIAGITNTRGNVTAIHHTRVLTPRLGTYCCYNCWMNTDIISELAHTWHFTRVTILLIASITSTRGSTHKISTSLVTSTIPCCTLILIYDNTTIENLDQYNRHLPSTELGCFSL